VAASFLGPILTDPTARWVLRNARHAGIVARTIETAFDSPTRNRGLLGRSGLADDHALILAPCSSIHTFFMQFAIDVAFVDREGGVLRVRQALGPWRIQIALRAFAVVEFASGSLNRSDTRAGDRLYLAAE
jgi:uncharacterized membrane protein (UPF0127 family)